jgi:hypothetical protein
MPCLGVCRRELSEGGIALGVVAASFRDGKVARNTILVKGWFDQSLPIWLAQHADDKIAFLNIDSDLYESAKTVLSLVGDRLQVGTIVHFDEYLNYPGWEDGAHKAWREFVQASGVTYTYIAYSRYGVALRIDEIGAASVR